MKRIFHTGILVSFLTFLIPLHAQSIGEMTKGGFGDFYFYPTANYVYSKGYPIGFQLGPLRLGFTTDEVKYYQSATEYQVPTWSWHISLMGGISVIGPVGINLGVDLGSNIVKRYRVDPLTPDNQFHNTKSYFGITPMIGLSFWWFNAFVGYEMVPAFKDIQGMVYGFGLTWVIEN